MSEIPTAEITVNGRRKIVNADDPRVSDDAQVTRESIRTMSRPDVIGHLAAHGIERPKGNLTKLREALERVLFVDF